MIEAMYCSNCLVELNEEERRIAKDWPEDPAICEDCMWDEEYSYGLGDDK